MTRIRHDAYGCLNMIVLAVAIIALLVMAGSAFAHCVYMADGTKFCFKTDCCNEGDCGFVPMSAIKEVKGGYEVDYQKLVGNPPRIQRITGFVPYGSKDIRFNPFTDRVMACHSLSAGSLPNTLKPRCIFPIVGQM